MDSVFRVLAVQPKTVTIDAGAKSGFRGNSGTRYLFWGNSIVTSTGEPVSGSIDISVAEYLNKGDMIFSKMLPISNNEPLASGGEINVVATQNGQRLKMKAGYSYEVYIPEETTALGYMRLFFGAPAVDTTNTVVNWVVADTVKLQTRGAFPFSADTLAILSDSLIKCNADRFLSSPNYQTFTVTIKGVSVPESAYIFAYALYDNFKGVWPLNNNFEQIKSVISEHHVPDIPVHFAIFGFIDGEFYGGITAATPKEGENYEVNLKAADAAAFKAELNSL